jgi:phosphatidylserine decarboxylase
MVEVSSCVINPDVIPGHHLDKGDELGYFQFGGSTVCLVFRPGVIQDFALQALPQTSETMTRPVKVRSRLATARLRTELDGEDPLRRPTAS